MKKKTEICKESVIKLLEEGMYLKEISKILGCNHSSLATFCRRNSVNYIKEKRGGKNFIDVTGHRFGSLTVIDRNLDKPDEQVVWNCRCDCGNIVTSKSNDLRGGKIKTCGCRMSIVSRRNWQGHGNISKSLWRVINRNAMQRGIEFNLTIEFLDELLIKQEFKCYLTGIVLSTEIRKTTASLDRIDSNKAYDEDNVRWIHKDINMLKNKYSVEKFIEMCRWIVEYDNLKTSKLLNENNTTTC